MATPKPKQPPVCNCGKPLTRVTCEYGGTDTLEWNAKIKSYTLTLPQDRSDDPEVFFCHFCGKSLTSEQVEFIEENR